MKKLMPFPLLAFAAGIAFAQPSADTVLSKADAIRNPQMDYTVKVKVTSFKGNQKPTDSTYKTMVKGRAQSVVLTQTPQIDRGRVLLMNGKNFWGYLPNVSKPLRISLQDRLTGDVSNGDLARTNFSGDYDPTIPKTESVNQKKCIVLDLKAKSEDVTYGRVVLWVEQATFRPVQAEFFAFSGRLLKTCSYENYKELGGAVRPTKLIMRDAVNKNQYSILEYENVVLKTLPEKYFTKDYMKNFQTE